MSDAAIASVVSGAITVVTIVITFLTLWVKLKYGQGQVEKVGVKVDAAAGKADIAADKAETAANRSNILEAKIDDNTAKTEEIQSKADVIAHQTNGASEIQNRRIDVLEAAVKGNIDKIAALADKLTKLDEYMHRNQHLMNNILNNLALKIERLLVISELKPPVVVEAVATTEGPK